MAIDPLREVYDQFDRYVRAGIDARLLLENRAGKLWINFQIQAQANPNFHKKVSPSRQRRREKRQSKQLAAENAVKNDSVPVASSQVKPIVSASKVTIEDATASEICYVTESSQKLAVRTPKSLYPPAAEEAKRNLNLDNIKIISTSNQTKPSNTPQSLPHMLNNLLPANMLQHGEKPHMKTGVQMNSTNKSPPDASAVVSDVKMCDVCQKVFETPDDIKWHRETKYGREDCKILKSMLP